MSTYTSLSDVAAFSDGSSAEYNQMLENQRYLYDRAGNTVKLTADLSATTSTTLANSTGLSFAVLSGSYYWFRFIVLFTSATATTGLKLGATTPTTTIYSARVQVPSAADGTDSEVVGWLSSSGDSVIGTGVETTGVVYAARVEGIIIPSADGTLQVQHAAEVGSAGNVVVKQGSAGWLSLIS